MEDGIERSRNFARAMQLFIGRGELEAVAQVTGVSVRNLYAYHGDENCPRWSVALRIMRHMPAPFCSMALQEAGIIRVVKSGEADPCSFKLVSDWGQSMGKFSEMLADGRFDHMEEAEIEQILHEVLPRIDAWLSARRDPKVLPIRRKGPVLA